MFSFRTAGERKPSGSPEKWPLTVVCMWRCYIVCLCMKGGQLIDVIRSRRGPLPCDEVLQACYQTCSAVHHMHRQRPPIIHRDLKVLSLRPFNHWLTCYLSVHFLVLVSDSSHEGSNALPAGVWWWMKKGKKPVGDSRVKIIALSSFNNLTLLVEWQEGHLAC